MAKEATLGLTETPPPPQEQYPGALIFGTLGYAPFAAGLYTNNRFGTEWLTLFGAALCGISAGVFWMAEAAIAIAYPEPWNKGKALGYWLTYRLGGQILGGAINLGLNADRNEAGKVSYTVFLIFIALQASGPLVALFLNKPEKAWIDRTKVSLKTRARSSFWLIVSFQGGWWTWATVLVTKFHHAPRTYDWSSYGFGHAFAVYIFLTIGFQINYLFLYFIITNLAETEDQVIRYAALLRGTESAWQAVSYGLTSIPIMGSVGAVYINFGLWAVAIGPAWLLVRHFGADWDHYGHDGEQQTKREDEVRDTPSPERVSDSIKI
ncbi:MAG: hypothetical protein Q9195_005391 [Heterodermia aff. obscurata]